MRTVDQDADESAGEDRFDALPERVQEALGELAGAAKEGLLALSVGVGLGVLAELMAEESRRSSGPTASMTRIARWSVTAMRAARSRSAAVACRSGARGSGRRTARARCRLPPTGT